MDVQTLLNRLFPEGHGVAFDAPFFGGTGTSDGKTVAVFGTTDAAPIGVELAFRLADCVLGVVRDHPGRAIVLLIDTQGQRLSRRDELLGINGYMAHLGKCIDLARRRGHRVVGLVYSEAVSGGFLSSSMLADACYALPEASVRVMNLPAMSRITKIPLERLEELRKESPVFAPGVDNYHRMGAIEDIWSDHLDVRLRDALAQSYTGDHRRTLGEERGGRRMARPVAERVRHAPR
jgi:malonate decarboxylase gamma subunit